MICQHQPVKPRAGRNWPIISPETEISLNPIHTWVGLGMPPHWLQQICFWYIEIAKKVYSHKTRDLTQGVWKHVKMRKFKGFFNDGGGGKQTDTAAINEWQIQCLKPKLFICYSVDLYKRLRNCNKNNVTCIKLSPWKFCFK